MSTQGQIGNGFKAAIFDTNENIFPKTKLFNKKFGGRIVMGALIIPGFAALTNQIIDFFCKPVNVRNQRSVQHERRR